MKTVYLCLLLAFVYLSLYIGSSDAQTMTNSTYILQMGNLNSGAGKATGPSYNVTSSLGQTGANLFSGTNYLVRAGFQYIYTIIPFRFSVSNTLIDFGGVTPTNAVLRTNQLTVSNGSANGYQVTVSQNHNLRNNRNGWEIQPTSCGDSGPTCTTTTAGPWTSSLNFGFGYRCDNLSGTDCNSQFSPSTYYEQFASSPSAVMVMSSANVGTSRQSQITYKVNVSTVQPAGLYTNVINFIATPTY